MKRISKSTIIKEITIEPLSAASECIPDTTVSVSSQSKPGEPAIHALEKL